MIGGYTFASFGAPQNASVVAGISAVTGVPQSSVNVTGVRDIADIFAASPPVAATTAGRRLRQAAVQGVLVEFTVALADPVAFQRALAAAAASGQLLQALQASGLTSATAVAGVTAARIAPMPPPSPPAAVPVAPQPASASTNNNSRRGARATLSYLFGPSCVVE